MFGRFAGGRGCAVEDVDCGRRHGLVGVGKEEADLPHLAIVELGLEGGHAGKTYAVFDLPVGFADRVVADADDVGIVAMRLEKLRGIGVFVRTNGRGVSVKAMTDCATVRVDVRTCGEVCCVGFHVGADPLAIDACVQGDVDELAFEGEGRVRDGNRHLSVFEVNEHHEGNKDDANDQSK